tara:strand:- start:177 stop:419 length:243 start_codon:yes stop_codon:yes gene_type:complete
MTVSMEKSEIIQQEILNYLQAFTELNNYAPTAREIQKGIGMRTLSNTQYHIEKLISRGLITRDPKKARTLALIEPGDDHE